MQVFDVTSSHIIGCVALTVLVREAALLAFSIHRQQLWSVELDRLLESQAVLITAMYILMITIQYSVSLLVFKGRNSFCKNQQSPVVGHLK